MEQVSQENLFIPPFLMDTTHPYFCSPMLSYGVSSNMTTPVDHALFDSMDAEAMLGAYMYPSTVVRFPLYFYILISSIGKSWF